MTKFSIIVPCAGMATRLDIPFSKALFPLEKGHALIDELMRIFVDSSDQVRFIFIISKENLDIVSYLSKYVNNFNMCFVFQKENEKGLFGAVESAKGEFSQYNLVFLPDSIIDFGYKKEVYFEKVKSKLLNSDLVFTVAMNFRIEQLLDEGVVVFDKSFKIIDLIDKPQNSLYDYLNYENQFGAWISIAFSKKIADNLIPAMKKNLEGIPLSKINSELLQKANIVPVNFFYDLGVWSRVYEYFKSR